MSKHIPRSKSVIIRQRNFRNIDLHACLDQAHKYSSLVNHHIITSQHQNQALKTAQHPYQFTPVKFMSQTIRNSEILIRKKHSNPEDSNPTFDDQLSTRKSKLEGNFISNSKISRISSANIITKSATKYPYSIPYHSYDPFVARTLKIEDINQLLVERQQQKKELKKKIQMLKRGMIEQKKKISKLTIESNKHMNGIEETNCDNRKKQQQSYYNNIQICSLQNGCVQIVRQIEKLQDKNNQKKAAIAEETLIKEQTKQYVYDARIRLRRIKQQLADVKQKQTVAQKSMTNNYMVMNQHKDEKAKLFNHIQNDVRQHPICKPFCRVQDD